MRARRVVSSRVIVALSACALGSPWAAPGVHAGAKGSPRMITVTPRETDELLANPNMGWQTFHRTKDKDRNLPDWIPSTVQYARWGWKVFEPRPGQIDEAFLDAQLAASRHPRPCPPLRR